MPIIVNGQVVPEELIRLESERLAQNPQWNQIADGHEREQRLRAAAEFSAVNHTLMQQTAASDPRPIEAGDMDLEFGFNDISQAELYIQYPQVQAAYNQALQDYFNGVSAGVNVITDMES